MNRTTPEAGSITSEERPGKRGSRSGPGKLYVVGIGPGGRPHRTFRAVEAIAESRVVVGYTPYLESIADLTEGKELIASGMTFEVQRCRQALARAAAGDVVALISSGDAGIYGMAGLALELAEAEGLHVPIEIVPGVTAASAAAAALGAPLMLDFAVISLSDLLIPWESIRRRLEAVAGADFVVALYNPRSKKRTGPAGRGGRNPAGRPTGPDSRRHRHRRRPSGPVAGHDRPGPSARAESGHADGGHRRQQPHAADRPLAGHCPRIPGSSHSGVTPMILLLGGTSNAPPWPGGWPKAAIACWFRRRPTCRCKRPAIPTSRAGRAAWTSTAWPNWSIGGTSGRSSMRRIPYAVEIRAVASRVAGDKGIPYLCFLRPAAIDPSMPGVEVVADHPAAAMAAFARGRPVLLTTGTRNLEPYVERARATQLPLGGPRARPPGNRWMPVSGPAFRGSMSCSAGGPFPWKTIAGTSAASALACW